MRLALTDPPPGPPKPRAGVPPEPVGRAWDEDGLAPVGGGPVGTPAPDGRVPPGPPKPDDGPPGPPEPPPNPAPALAGPASTLLEVRDRPTVATLYDAGPAASATAPVTAATARTPRVRTPRRRATAPAIAIAAATGIATRSHGAKSGVRASRVTATHAVVPTAAPSATTPSHEVRAQRASATTPKPARAAIAGARALT